MAEFYNTGFHGKSLFSSIKSGTKYIENFLSGFAGYGWKLWEYTSGKWKLEVDAITVRGPMTIFELLVSKIRSIKGALGITQGFGKIAAVELITPESGDPYYSITLDDKDLSFVANDFFRCQTFSGTSQKMYHVEIASIVGNSIHVLQSEFTDSLPEVGDDIVQFGNSVNTARQSAIYLHADEDGQPAIDVMFGINSKNWDGCVKIRIGGDIPGTDGLKGFYCVNGLIKGVNDTGSVMYQINPDGSASFAQDAVNFKADKSGFIAGGAISWAYNATTAKYECTLASNVVLTWNNLSTETQNNLKGEKGDSGAVGATGATGTAGHTFKWMFYASDSYEQVPSFGQGIISNPNDDPDASNKWSYTPSTSTTFIYIWMIQAEFDGSGVIVKQSDNTYWTDPVCITGSDGKNGTDGTYVEFIYQSSTSATAPTTPTSVNTDGNIPSGWTDHPTGVTSTSMYEYVCVRYKKNGTWGIYSTAVLWAKWGEKGQDGDGFEYVYKGTAINTSPSTPVATGTSDDEVPTGWTDNPTGVTSILPYEWVSVRKKTNGTWGAFSAPAVWAKYGEDGSKGDPGADAVVYSITPTSYAVKKSISGIFSPKSVVFTFQKTTGSSTVDYSGYRRIYHSSDGNTFTESITTATAVTSATVTPDETDKLIKCNLYSDSARTVLLDSQIVIITADGDNALSGVLTNDSAALPANSEGVVSDYSNASGNFIVYWGTTNVTDQCTFAVDEGDNVTGSINNETNKGYYAITEYVGVNSSSSGSLSVTATYNAVTISKTFSVSKSKAGANGTDGTDANLLPWVEEWNTNATEINGESVVSPKMFSGTKDSTGKLTGIAMGRECITINNVKRTGIFALVDDEVVFELDPITKKYKFKGEVNSTLGVFEKVLRVKTSNTLFETTSDGVTLLSDETGFNINFGVVDGLYGADRQVYLPVDKEYDGTRALISNNGGYNSSGNWVGGGSVTLLAPEGAVGSSIFTTNAVFPTADGTTKYAPSEMKNKIFKITVAYGSVLRLWAFWMPELDENGVDIGVLKWYVENPNDFYVERGTADNGATVFFVLNSREGNWV